MRPSLRALPKRAADKARATAAGSPEPAGQEPPPPGAADRPGAAERAAMRRRIRKVARTRDALTRELGMLLVEMERLDRRNDELLARRAREVTILDDELRRLRDALGERQTLDRVVAAGIVGPCAACGNLLGTEDRYCSRCGKAVGDDGADGDVPPPPPPSQLRLETVGAERT